MFSPLKTKVLCKYTDDWDMDDLVDEYLGNLTNCKDGISDNLENIKLPIEYKSIVLICLIFFYYKHDHPYNKELELLRDITTTFKDEGEEQSDSLQLTQYIQPHNYIDKSIDNIYNLLKEYFSLPNAITSSSAKKSLTADKSLTLYSGISSYKISIVKNILSPGVDNYHPGLTATHSEIMLPTFISTSLNIDTALRFASNEDCPYKTIIQFHIPKEKLAEFRWCPLFKKCITFPCRQQDAHTENEILLPPGALFKFSSNKPSREINIPKQYYIPSDGLSGKCKLMHDKVTIYNLEFIGYSSNISESSRLTQLIDDMKTTIPFLLNEEESYEPLRKRQKQASTGRGMLFTKKRRHRRPRRDRRQRQPRHKTNKRQRRQRQQRRQRRRRTRNKKTQIQRLKDSIKKYRTKLINKYSKQNSIR